MKLTARSFVITSAVASALPFAAIVSAAAADLNAPANVMMPTKAPPYIAPYSWTGFYVGAHVGYGWGSVDNAYVSDPLNTAHLNTSTSPNGVEGGGQIGFNYEVSNWVLGIEGDIGAADLTGSSSFTPGTGTATLTNKIDWIDDVTGRVGYAWGPWLLYGKGGWAWSHGTANITNTATTITGSSSASLEGWTAGAGVEWMFIRNWSAKLEYQHFDFGSSQTTTTYTSGQIGLYNTGSTVDLVRVGVNYHFWAW